MKIVYRLVSYSRKSERILAKYDVPQQAIEKAKAIAGIGNDDDGLGDYPLDRGQAKQIAALLSAPMDTESADYFLEPYVYEANADNQAPKA